MRALLLLILWSHVAFYTAVTGAQETKGTSSCGSIIGEASGDHDGDTSKRHSLYPVACSHQLLVKTEWCPRETTLTFDEPAQKADFAASLVSALSAPAGKTVSFP